MSRFFWSVMQSWIYESMDFVGKSKHGFVVLSHASFCQSIIDGCELARTVAHYVKRCSFSDWVRDGLLSSWRVTEFRELYSRALAFMLNVEELKLTKIPINKNLLKTRSMMELECLTSLSLDLCVIEDVEAKHIHKLSTLQLKFLMIKALHKHPMTTRYPSLNSYPSPLVPC